MSNVIVVGVDGSPESRNALEWALAEGLRLHASVEAVIAWEFTQFREYRSMTPYEVERRAAAILHNAVVGVLSSRAENPPVTEHQVEGPPVRALVGAAESATMVVVGCRGRGRAYDLLLGSVSARCVRRASCPVVVVPTARRRIPFRKGTFGPKRGTFVRTALAPETSLFSPCANSTPPGRPSRRTANLSFERPCG